MGWILSFVAKAKDFYDWASFGEAFVKAAEHYLGISVISGLAGSIGSLVLGATGVQATLYGMCTGLLVIGGATLRAIKKEKPAFKILYDETNPGEKYWSHERWPPNADGLMANGMEYRVGILNNTNRTLKNVSVTIEGIGGDWKPSKMSFGRAYGPTKMDIHPGCIEHVIAFLISQQTDAPISDLTIRVKAKDTPEYSEVFKLDHSREPALYRGS